MNEDIKRRWVEALRSGVYEQGTGHLRTSDNKYCCLGVLCDIWAQDVGVEWAVFADLFSIKGVILLPPSDVICWAGLQRQYPEVYLDDELCTLSKLNDNGKTFAEIADLIEAQL